MISYKDEYFQALRANKQLTEENKKLKSIIDKLRMDLDADGMVY